MNFNFHQGPYSYFQSAIVTSENEAQFCVLNKKKILQTDSFLSNAEYEVSICFCFCCCFFFYNISQKQNQKGHNIQLYRNAK